MLAASFWARAADVSKEKLEPLDLFAVLPLELDGDLGGEFGLKNDLLLDDPEEYVRPDDGLDDREDDDPDE